jgi:hypothetical protein
MMRKEIPVVLCPFKKVFLLVVVRNQGDLLLSSHGDNLMAHETVLRMMVFLLPEIISQAKREDARGESRRARLGWLGFEDCLSPVGERQMIE